MVEKAAAIKKYVFHDGLRVHVASLNWDEDLTRGQSRNLQPDVVNETKTSMEQFGLFAMVQVMVQANGGVFSRGRKRLPHFCPKTETRRICGLVRLHIIASTFACLPPTLPTNHVPHRWHVRASWWAAHRPRHQGALRAYGPTAARGW